jgi:hypothetical protein
MKYTKELLMPIVATSTSIAGVLAALQLPLNSNNRCYISRHIRTYGLDTAHFEVTAAVQRTDWQKVLVLLAASARKEIAWRLRRALIESGREYICEECKCAPVWRNKPLTFEIHHKNGNNRDNRAANLAFLCPNCHTQITAATYKGEVGVDSFRPAKSTQCPECGKPKTAKAKLCAKCNWHQPQETLRKVKRPTKAKLEELLQTKTMAAVAKQFGVAASTVRFWRQSYVAK